MNCVRSFEDFVRPHPVCSFEDIVRPHHVCSFDFTVRPAPPPASPVCTFDLTVMSVEGRCIRHDAKFEKYIYKHRTQHLTNKYFDNSLLLLEKG